MAKFACWDVCDASFWLIRARIMLNSLLLPEAAKNGPRNKPTKPQPFHALPTPFKIFKDFNGFHMSRETPLGPPDVGHRAHACGTQKQSHQGKIWSTMSITWSMLRLLSYLVALLQSQGANFIYVLCTSLHGSHPNNFSLNGYPNNYPNNWDTVFSYIYVLFCTFMVYLALSSIVTVIVTTFIMNIPPIQPQKTPRILQGCPRRSGSCLDHCQRNRGSSKLKTATFEWPCGLVTWGTQALYIIYCILYIIYYIFYSILFI